MRIAMTDEKQDGDARGDDDDPANRSTEIRIAETAAGADRDPANISTRGAPSPGKNKRRD
jgi:hypothetical protein